jgi:hypothetical protein
MFPAEGPDTGGHWGVATLLFNGVTVTFQIENTKSTSRGDCALNGAFEALVDQGVYRWDALVC